MRAAPLVMLGALLACGGGDDDDTLEPLPIEGATVATPSTSVAAPSNRGSTTTVAVTSTSAVAAPIGDWDGARFDAGTINALSTAGTNRTISFDRYSYSDPAVGTIDADAFDEEPLAGWWRTSPFSNVRTQVRTFVLDPDVEVLVLDPAGRASACAGPPPASPPTPTWKPADVDVLEDPAYVGAIATLTYSPTGQVERIRFTQGC